jgi:hypothetical protein
VLNKKLKNKKDPGKNNKKYKVPLILGMQDI